MSKEEILERNKKISDSLTGRAGHPGYWKGKNLPEEVKEKMRKSGKGKNKGPISEKRRKAIINGMKKQKTNITHTRLKG